MGEEKTSLGRIHISPNAVATIAYHATLESYGVVGLAPKNIADGLVKSITKEPSRGVTVRYNGEDIDIEIHIVVEYGTRINSVADSVANTVRCTGVESKHGQRACSGVTREQSGLGAEVSWQ
jgi:uncharacterized alkaline shock family protein YloU